MDLTCTVTGCARLAHFHISDGARVEHYCEEHAEQAIMALPPRTTPSDGTNLLCVSVTVSFVRGGSENFIIGEELLQRFPRTICHDLLLLPVEELRGAITIAAAKKPSLDHLEVLRFCANQEIEVRIATLKSLASAINLCEKLDWS
jgi:hypothetical protein